jgi:hypothetical protein
MGVEWLEVGLMSRVVVIYDDIVWGVGETPRVECDARHQGHCKTAELRGDRAVRSQELRGTGRSGVRNVE